MIDKQSKQNELGVMRSHDMNVSRVENHADNSVPYEDDEETVFQEPTGL